MPEMSSKKYVFTLIHGTFARSAAWTDTNSPFCTRLREELRRMGSDANFFSSPWTGQNSQAARQEAAEHLVAHTLDIASRYPDRTHILVGHSHGGNVALYSCANPEVERNVYGIICLATPFFGFLRRNTYQVATPLIFFTVFLLVGLALNLSQVFSVNWLYQYLLGYGLAPRIAAWSTIAVLFLFAIIASLGAHVANLMDKPLDSAVSIVDCVIRYRDSIIVNNSAPRIPGKPVLCLWTPGDEVTSLFQLMLWITNAPLIVLNMFAMTALFLASFIAHFFFPIPFELSLMSEPVRNMWREIFTLVAGPDYADFPVTIVARSSSAFMLAFLSFVLLLLLTSIIAMIFGWVVQRYLVGTRKYSVGGAILVKVVPSLTPLTSADVEFYDIECRKGILGHSKIYNDRQTIDKIVTWLERLGTNRGYSSENSTAPSA